MTDKTAADRATYVKAMVASAIAAAGIGAVAKNIRERKARAEANNVSTSKNTIVVPVLKSKFMEGLPTPDDLKKSRGEGESASSDTQTAQAAQTAQPSQTMTPEEIAAKKREIVGGRRVDFFGKRAEKTEKTEKSDEGKGESKSEGEKGEKKDEKEGRLLFRDQNGKFVSPSDPVAVESVEKSAEGEGYDWTKGIFNTIFHPIDTAGVMFNAAKDKPVLMTAGAVGSIILAAKISDSINKMRRERSKDRLDKARSQYVALLEGGDSEKAAQASNDPRVPAGALIGGAFVVPLALTALVTNRIIENRKNEKKREKEMSDSFPDEPIILYKTSEDKEIRISPETALFAIMVKSAMYESVEAEERNFKMGKEAQVKEWFGKQIGKGIGALGKAFSGVASPMSVDEASNTVMKMLENPDNNNHFLSLVQNPKAGLSREAVLEMAGRENPLEMARLYQSLNDPKMRSQIINNVKTGKRTQDLIISRATDDKYADSWGKFKTDKINEALTGYGFSQGGLLHKMFSWILNNTGLGNYFVKNKINDYFAQMRDAGKAPAQAAPASQAAPAAQTAQVAQTAAAPAPAPAAPTAATPAAKAPTPAPAPSPAPAPAQTASWKGFAPGSTAGTPTKSIA